MNTALAGSVFVTLFVIIDPVGIIPVFLAAVGRRPGHEVHRLAWQAAVTSLGLITLFAVFGDFILNYLGISSGAMRVSGGLLLLLVALQLLLSGEVGATESSQDTNIALVPLGTPLLAGPGAIVATILFVRESDTTERAQLRRAYEDAQRHIRDRGDVEYAEGQPVRPSVCPSVPSTASHRGPDGFAKGERRVAMH